MTYLKNDKGIPHAGYAVTTEHVGTEARSLLNEMQGIPPFLSHDQGIVSLEKLNRNSVIYSS